MGSTSQVWNPSVAGRVTVAYGDLGVDLGVRGAFVVRGCLGLAGDLVALRVVNLDEVVLNGANLDGETLEGATLEGATLEGLSLDGATLEDRKSTRLNSSHL